MSAVERFEQDNADAEQGEVEVVRRSFMPGILSTMPVTVRQKFKAIGGKRSKRSDGLLKVRSLGPKRLKSAGLTSKFLSGKDFSAGTIVAPMLDLSATSDVGSSEVEDEAEAEPEYREHERLILHEPSQEECEGGAEVIEVPPILCQWLRPHQREGVQFLYKCLSGQQLP